MNTEIIEKVINHTNIRLILEDRRLVVTNFIKEIDKYYSEDRVGSSLYNKREYDLGKVKLPFCQSFYEAFYLDSDWMPKTREERIWYCWAEVNNRLKYRIRMYGDEGAIDLLMKIYGNELAINILSKFAIQNQMVAIKLNEIINNLKEKELIE